MKKIAFYLAISLFMFSCGTTDKKAELNKLKKQHDQLTEKIKEIEAGLSLEDDTPIGKSIQIVAEEVAKKPFAHYVEVQGKVDGEDNIGVSARMNGVITDINVKVGDAVRKGQILAQIDDEVLQQTMQELMVQLDFATDIYNKQKNLWDKKIGSEVQFLSAKSNKESLEKRLAALKDQLDMCKIVSPINGTVEEVPLKVGQAVNPGYNVIRVVNFSRVKVTAEVSEAYTNSVKKGDDVSIFFPDINQELQSKVSFASRYINPIDRTFLVEIRLNPGQVQYRANMVAVIKIKDYSVPSTYVLPMNAVLTEENKKYVYLVESEGNKLIAKKKYVTLGQNYNGFVEVLDGVTTTNKVVTKGYQKIEDGQVVTL